MNVGLAPEAAKYWQAVVGAIDRARPTMGKPDVNKRGIGAAKVRFGEQKAGGVFAEHRTDT
ncbi:hypothetical protein D3C84_1013670 [compost metagenome]